LYPLGVNVMIRILIADDHAIVREGLKLILGEAPDMEVVAEAGSGPETMSMIHDGSCDLVLLDISMPGSNGIEVLKSIKREVPTLPVLILSMYPEGQYAIRALKAGASGYLTKDGPSEELLAAIRKTVAGGRYVSSSLAETLAFSLDEKTNKLPHELLTDREYQVFQLIVSGMSTREIAGLMTLSIKTVSTYRTRVLGKMNMKSNAHLARYAVQHGLID
jgi:two-component system, NarL family, invasion response regulator UvrY